MTREKRGHYAGKHPADLELDRRIADTVREEAEDGKLSCAAVFKIAKGLQRPASEVGTTMDLLEIRITKCQLGLFGYEPRKRIVKPAQEVPSELQGAIEKGLAEGRLPCEAAWRISEELGVGKMEVSSACEALKIKVSSCQIGAF